MGRSKDQPNAWILEHVSNAILYLAEEHKVVALAERSLEIVSGFTPFLNVALRALRQAGKEVEAINLDGFRQDCMDTEKLVLEERNAGYPLLWKHSTVSVWSILETTAEGLILNLIQRIRDSAAAISVSEPNVEIPKKFDPSDHNRCKALFNNWQRELSSTNVAERYIEMLSTFEINVRVSSDDKRSLAELAEARHIILHRRSKVDERFITKCPWTSYAVDDLYRVSRDDYVRFWEAAAAMAQSMLEGVVESPWLRTVAQ